MPRGRPFQPGNPGGPGRPKRSVEQDYLSAVMSAVSPEELAQITVVAKEQALKGDRHARDWLSKQLIGTDPIPVAALIEEMEAIVLRFRQHEQQAGETSTGTHGNGKLPPAPDRHGESPN